MALEILERVEYEQYNTEDLNAWRKDKFYELRANPAYDQLPYIMLLVKIDGKVGEPDREHMELLEEIYDRALAYLMQEYSSNGSFDIFLMEDALQTSILLKKEAEFLEKTMDMESYYAILQEDNGCFRADKRSESNILP